MIVPEPLPATAHMELATIAQRFAARLVDAVVFLVPVLVLVLAVAGEDASGDPTVPLWLSYAMLGVSAVYDVTMVAVRGQTVGKIVMRCKVVRADGSGRVPTLGSAAIRYLLPAVVAGVPIPLVQLGSIVIYLWALWDPNRQGLHDKAAGTMVVRVEGDRSVGLTR